MNTINSDGIPSDPFLWLEEVESPEALAWVRKHNERTLTELESDPRFAELHADATALANAHDRMTFGGLSGGYVYNFWQDETNVRGLWRRALWESWRKKAPDWQTLLDIDQLARDEDANWVFKSAARLDPENPSTRCLISLSNGGKDAVVVREFDLDTKSFVSNGFFLPESKTIVEWLQQDLLLVATNWGEGSLTRSGYPFIVKVLPRGKPHSEAVEIFRGDPADALISAPFRFDDGVGFRHFVARAPTFFSNEYFLLAAEAMGAPPQRLRLPTKCRLFGLHRENLVFQPQEDGPLPGESAILRSGAIYCAPLQDLAAAGPIRSETIAEPGARESINDVQVAQNGLYIASTRNVCGEVRHVVRADTGEWNHTSIALPSHGVVSAKASRRRPDVFYSYQNLITPPSLLDRSLSCLESEPSRFDASDLMVSQFETVSSDGERIPYFEVRKRDAVLDGELPTLLYGYGGFKIPMLPDYSPVVGKLWLERGGAFVLANIRGGGEFGPDWHAAGLKTKRQLIFDDFIAVATNLIERRLTNPKRLGIMGGSNGGLLMGVMLAQRPDLFGAAVIQVPLLDMLRFHLLLAGASWIDEYGSPESDLERVFLERISPYHTVDVARLIEIRPFFVTSTKDDRVHPAHARKLAARLEAACAPFYYFENIDGGHGAAANRNEGARRQALEFTYLARRLR
jgi:prolyl oligopeptidase